MGTGQITLALSTKSATLWPIMSRSLALISDKIRKHKLRVSRFRAVTFVVSFPFFFSYFALIL